MSRTIVAIFDSGVFRPLEPVGLAEGTHVEVQLPPTLGEETAVELSPEEITRRRSAIDDMISEIERLPIEGPNDGFSGRDHDKILYGRP